ncbi:hypothetical protein [Rhodococcus pyridinivorans]|uniref:hypothetical protein n=1 Tax=Rhodococcus pyridinivorans TaxID=103816 RepID=UPI0020785B68|nr:hypothetical protein [Rhodococcus pyridinivorans]USI90399.1 hypothetical protein LLA01_00085 [Rhodococcus pyridinivorans]
MKLRAMAFVPALILLAACSSEPDRVTAVSVAEQCDPESTYFDLSEDEKSIEFHFRPGTESSEVAYTCLLEKSGAPSSVDYRIMETRPIDGTQTAEWEGWELYWRYEGKGDGTPMHLSEV